MNMERAAGLIFEGKITDEQIKKIPKDFRGDIIVNGNIICLEDCKIPGSLWINGNLEAKHLRVEGDLFAKKGTTLITEEGIDVSGDFIFKEYCDIDTTCINVGGDFEGKGEIDSTDINVYGTFEFYGKIDLNNFKIHAGKLELGATITKCEGIKSGY